MHRTPTRLAALSLALVLASGCVSTTLIRSEPSGAKVYLNGEPVGKTPYPMSDTKIVGTATQVRLVLDGYQPFDTFIQRNEVFDAGACIGGVLVLVPFLWIQGYKPEHTYELSPLRPPAPAPAPAPAAAPRT